MSYSRKKKIEDRGKKMTEERDGEIICISTTANRTRKQVLNSSTPCAACKFLRRRCVLECPFFPYFSPNEPQKFAAIHKVFGASNVSKMLMEVPEAQRADTANSLVYEANLRLRDPVYGCMGAIIVLQKQVQKLETELRSTKEELLKHSYSQSLPDFLSSSSMFIMNNQWQNQNLH